MRTFYKVSLSGIKSLFVASLVFFATALFAQTENFEDEVSGNTTFTVDGAMFNTTGDFQIHEFNNFSCGGTNTGLNRYLSSGFNDGASSGVIGALAPADPCVSFRLNTSNNQWGWTGRDDGDNPTSGMIRFTGTKLDNTTVSQDISFSPPNFTALVPFTFNNSIWGGIDLLSLQMEIVGGGDCDYFAMDELIFDEIKGQSISFTALADLCSDAGVQAGLGSGTPTGGVYSGPGVTDNGNGSTYSFNPSAAGVGNHTITYSYTIGGNCSGISTTDNVAVFALPNLSMTLSQDQFCESNDITTIQGGNPVGGTYSGPGVTNNGNGTSFNFNPTAAGLGTHTVTYQVVNANGCEQTITDQIVVTALPDVNFAAPADLCISSGVQSFGGGTPTGGSYSGPGVTDNGDGMTYIFNPSEAGLGIKTILYAYTNADGCSDQKSDDVEVISEPTVSFTPLANLCLDAGLQDGLGGGTPTGGVYSGPGVTDAGNGMTYSFDPSVAGLGTHSVTYTYDAGCSVSSSGAVEVFDLPVVSIDLPDTLLMTQANPLTGIGGGSPAGGTYTANFPSEMSDDGNGMTFSFNNTIVIGDFIEIIYSYTDANGCMNTATENVFIGDLSTDVVDFERLDLKVFPNPTTGRLNIQGASIDHLSLTDLQGRSLLNEENPDEELDISDLPSGLYFLRVVVDDQIATTRIIKE